MGENEESGMLQRDRDNGGGSVKRGMEKANNAKLKVGDNGSRLD